MSRASMIHAWPLWCTAACSVPAADDVASASPTTTTAGFESTSGRGTLDDPGTTAADDDASGTADATAETEGTGSTGSPACPELPDPAPRWLGPVQLDLVARLSGASEIQPGTTLPERSTSEHRATTRAFLRQQLAAIGLKPQDHAYSASGTNVYATLPATIDTDRAVVVGAHFDTVPGSPGANDNATGVAMALSLARWLDALPCRELDVIVVLFDEEELGLRGSFAFASWLADQPLDVVSVHTIDQMGWDADGDRALELERADEGLFELYQDAEALVPGSTPLVPTNTGFTDHVSFRELGFAAVGLTEEFVSGDTTPHYHLPSDAFDTVDLDYLASSTALLHAAIGSIVAPARDG